MTKEKKRKILLALFAVSDNDLDRFWVFAPMRHCLLK
jgi:hypothetical protein